jgi:hypothetical protein
MRQAEPALHEPEELVEIVAEGEKVAVAIPAVAAPKINPAVRPASTSVAGAKVRPAAVVLGAAKAVR